jgi:hypothetical protein
MSDHPQYQTGIISVKNNKPIFNSSMNVYQKNLIALEKSYPDLIKALKIISTEDIIHIKSKSNLPVIAKKEGNSIFPLGSLDDPQRDARELITAYHDKQVNHWIFAGIGSGYELIEAMRYSKEMNNYLVIELDLTLLKHILAQIDVSQLISSNNFVFYWNEDQDLHETIEAFFDKKCYINHAILKEKSLSESRPKIHKKIVEKIEHYFQIFNIDLESNYQSFPLILRNQLQNIPFIFKGKKVKSLFNSFNNIPAIIIGAGPSLDRNVDLLYGIEKKAILIATDTVAKKLSMENIKPHFIISGDPYIQNYFHFIDYKPVDSFLVFEPRINSRIPSIFDENIFITSFGSAMMKLIESCTGDFGNLDSWGSVSTMAFDLAVKMKCNPIIFVGQDLAYTDNRYYCKGTYPEIKQNMIAFYEDSEDREKYFSKIIQSKGTLEADDIYGKKTLTDRMMLNYKSWLEDKIKKANRLCINSTEGGILKENILIMPLEKALFEYAKCDIDINIIIRQLTASSPSPTGSFNSFKSLLADIKKSIEIIKDLCKVANERQTPKTEEKHLYQSYGSTIEATRRKIMEIVNSDPLATLIKEGNELNFFMFRKKSNQSGLDIFELFKVYREFFEATKNRCQIIMKEIQKVLS